MKSILDALGKFVSPDLIYGGGGLVVVLMAVFFILSVLWGAAVAVMNNKVQAWLGKHSRWLLVVVFIGLISLGAGGRRYYTAGVMVALALAIVVMQWKMWPKWASRPRPVIVVATVVFVLILGGEGWKIDRSLRQQNARLTVYVVLSFQALHGEDQQTLLGLSRSLRDSVEGVFGPLADVRVVPKGFQSLEQLDDWRVEKTVLSRLHDDLGLDADVMLSNYGSLIDEVNDNPARKPRQLLRFLLRPQLPVRRGGEIELEAQEPIMVTGYSGDVRYLSIRASVELLAQLKKSSRILKPADEEKILRNAADAYAIRLQGDGCPGGLCAALRTAAARKPLNVEELRNLMATYPPDQSARLNEIMIAEGAALQAKVHGPSETEPQPPPGPPALAPKATPAPRPVRRTAEGRS